MPETIILPLHFLRGHFNLILEIIIIIIIEDIKFAILHVGQRKKVNSALKFS